MVNHGEIIHISLPVGFNQQVLRDSTAATGHQGQSIAARVGGTQDVLGGLTGTFPWICPSKRGWIYQDMVVSTNGGTP
jgi:hypothetical protein